MPARTRDATPPGDDPPPRGQARAPIRITRKEKALGAWSGTPKLRLSVAPRTSRVTPHASGRGRSRGTQGAGGGPGRWDAWDQWDKSPLGLIAPSCDHLTSPRRARHSPPGRRRPASCSFHSGSSRASAPGGGPQSALAGRSHQQVGPSSHPVGGAVHTAPRSRPPHLAQRSPSQPPPISRLPGTDAEQPPPAHSRIGHKRPGPSRSASAPSGESWTSGPRPELPLRPARPSDHASSAVRQRFFGGR